MTIINSKNTLELVCSKSEILMIQMALSDFPELQEDISYTETTIHIRNPDVIKERLAELLKSAGIKAYT